MSYPLYTQGCNWQLPRLAEDKLRPMPIAIERKPRPFRPEVPHSLQYCQAAQLVKPIPGINKSGSTWLCILSEELKGPQCLLISITLFLGLAAARPSATSSSVPAVSIVRLPISAAIPPLSSSSITELSASSSSHRLPHALSSHHCPTACVPPYMPASRPAQSWRLPHAFFPWSLAALIISLARALQSVSPLPIGRNPGHLSSATRQHAISAQ